MALEVLLFKNIIIIFGLAIVSLFVCHLIRIPTLVGFLATGVLAGTHGLGLIRDIQQIETLAEIGVVLLLFSIGIDFSMKKLLEIKKPVLLGGSLQVILTILAIFTLAKYFGLSSSQSLFIGFLISLSSTAIVLKILQERAEVDSPHGRTTLGILIFQDMIMVLMMLFTPMLSGGINGLSNSLILLVFKGLGIIVLVIIGAKWIVPALLYQVTRTRNRELFLLSIVVLCFAVAWLTSNLGLSIGLGAFLAGLIISESEYSYQALGGIIPFRDVFTSFFFISIGMLLDVKFFLSQPGLILLITLLILVLKTIVASFVSFLLGLPLRTSILIGFSLSQIGEFSFVLSKFGMDYNLLSNEFYQIFLAASILTMALTPFIIMLAPKIADFVVFKLPLSKRLKLGFYPIKQESSDKKDHLIIVGFGLNGRNLARAAKSVNIPYVIIEMNPETIRKERSKGEPIYYGDAVNEEVLKHANIKNARVLVIAISDPIATRKITKIAREFNSKIYIIVRTPYIKEVGPLNELGADEVVPEEFETSVEIFTRVLVKYLIPKDDIERFVNELRSGNYKLFRRLSNKKALLSDLSFSDLEVTSLRVNEKSALAGTPLSQIDLRKKHGITILAIRRGNQVIPNPASETIIYPGDILILLGQPDKLSSISRLFES